MSRNVDITRIKFYVVRAEYDGAPESYLVGVYPTKELAETRCKQMEKIGYDLVWFDEVLMGPHGGDCMECNR